VDRPLDQLRDDAVLERLFVAEEPRDADEQILVERAQLAGVAPELLDVHVDVERPVEGQAPLDAARDGARLVVGEVDAVLVAEQAQDRVDAALLVGGALGRPLLPGPAEGRQRRRDLLRWQHAIDAARAHRAQRHAVELCRVRALAEDRAARLADFQDAARAVAAAARQDHRHGALSGILSERPEERIDGKRESVPRIPVAQQQPPLPDDHLLHRRQQVDGVGLDRHLVLGRADAHGRASRQQLIHEAPEVRREMLQDDEGHAGIGGKLCEQPLERIEPSR